MLCAMESAPDAKARTACCNTVFHQERRGLEQVHLGLSRCLKSLKSLLSLILVRPKGSAKTILTGSQQFLPRDSFCSFCALLKPLRYSPAFLDQNMEKHCDLDKNRRKVNALFHPSCDHCAENIVNWRGQCLSRLGLASFRESSSLQRTSGTVRHCGHPMRVL